MDRNSIGPFKDELSISLKKEENFIWEWIAQRTKFSTNVFFLLRKEFKAEKNVLFNWIVDT